MSNFRGVIIYLIYKPFRSFGRGTTPCLGDLLTMVTNHLLTGMILQVDEEGPSKEDSNDEMITKPSWCLI